MKKILRISILIPVLIALLVGAIFGVWYLLPKKALDIRVLDKTVDFSSQDNSGNNVVYRKHKGLYWILRNNRYVSPGNNSFYNYKTDYYGPQMGKDGNVSDKALSTLGSIPDLIYLADAYGTDAVQKAKKGGISAEEMAVVSDAYLHGTTVVGEFNITPSEKDDPVRAEMQTLFGLKYTDWVGRYIKDMADLTDIPSWVLELHERNYGRKWDYTGAGIILASGSGELIILEQGSDYTGNMSVAITDKYKKTFGGLKINYYNWFEIVSADYGTETVADYNIPLTDAGKEKFNKVSSETSFPAILLSKSGTAPVYYFAGDFNDYVASERYSDFLFSDVFHRIFSYDRAGDITNFYWNFYTPLMEKVLSDAYKAKASNNKLNDGQTPSFTRLRENQFEYNDGTAWKALTIKGFNLNAAMPGSQPGSYTRDISVYRYLLDAVREIGGNCVRVYDLMPPEFYRALYEYNFDNPSNKIYFFQSIVPPDIIESGQNLAAAAVTEQVNNIHSVIDAVNGGGSVPAYGKRAGGTYISDVSPYLMGYITELDMTASAIKAINDNNSSYSYQGSFVSGGTSSTTAAKLMAMLCDEVFSYQKKTYHRIVPVGALGSQFLLPNDGWNKYSGGAVYDVSGLETSGEAAGQLFLTYSLKPDDALIKDNAAAYSSYTDNSGALPYGGYIKAFKALESKYPVLIDRVSLSTNMNLAGSADTTGGFSEMNQGTGLVRLLNAIQNTGYLGGLISDLDDSWSNCSNAMKAFTIPFKNNPLWHNVLDPTQNTGIIAVESEPVTEIGMSLKDTERMSEVQMQTDEEYLYLTILLSQDTNYDTEKLIVGLDTYHRNLGEYFFDSGYFANSLSGMEYVISFESKNDASIYVTPGYNRLNGRYIPTESYTGKYDLLAKMQYGTFETTGNTFYQTGNTMHIRIPWSMLNFTDPANKIVISDSRSAADIQKDAYGIQTQTTSGVIFSLLIADRKTKDTLYIFPLNKQANGYKAFNWTAWEKPTWQFRHKESFDILSRYFGIKK